MAALGEFMKKRIQAQATCDVCQDFYAAPVILRCGSSFCRDCVEDLSPAVCPDCGADFDPGRLTPNQNLARLVEIARKLLEQEERWEASARGAAGAIEPRREETYFCRQEKVIICQACYEPDEHQGHDVVLADLAASEYKVHLRKCLIRLKTEEKDILLNKTTLEVDCEYYRRRAALMWEKINTEFQQMEEFLERQKRQQLAQVTEVYKEIKSDKNEQLSALSKKLSFLQDVGYEMEEASQLPGCELLENIGGIQRKFDERETVQPRGSLSLDLQNKISGLSDFNVYLQGSMKHFRDNVESRLNRRRGITTQNPNGSDPAAITPEDPPSASGSDQPQPSNPESSGLPSE